MNHETIAPALFSLMFLALLFGGYFTPTIIAVCRKHKQVGPIAAVNILLGWSILGWIAAFIWSLMSPSTPAVVHHYHDGLQPKSAVASRSDRPLTFG